VGCDSTAVRCLHSDGILDACALVTAMMDRDTLAAETILRFGCPADVSLTLAAWMASALGQLDSESADVLRAGWRQRADELREQGR
jgi:hypothetical protein